MKQIERVMLGCLMLAAAGFAAGVTAQSNSSPQQKPSPPASPINAHTANPDRGQRVFKENCSRCHNAPQGFPPSISGTVAKHMRIRANLSEADYQALLRFLNPQ
jgi:mono/diheme cytochrome c family protein